MDRGMSRACTSLLNFIRSRPWTPTPDEKEGRTLFDVCHSKRDATCAINPTDGQTFLSTVFDVRPSRRPRFLLATGDTLLLLFRPPPPHSHKKYSSLSKLRDPKQFPFRSSERKRKKKRRRDRRFLLPLENSLPTISDSTRGRTSDRIVFERVAENSFRSVVEMSPRKATFSDLARVSESDFRNWGVRERKEFVVRGSGPSIPLRLLSGVRVARDADPSTTLKKKKIPREESLLP